MDLGITITGIVMLALFVVPIVIVSVINKRKNQPLLLKLREVANQNNCTVSDYNIHHQFIIGMSSLGEYMFFVQQKEGDEELVGHSIPLNEVKECTVHTIKRSETINNELETVIDRIELVFYFKSKDQRVDTWLLYDSEISIMLDNEVQIGDKWVSDIKGVLK